MKSFENMTDKELVTWLKKWDREYLKYRAAFERKKVAIFFFLAGWSRQTGLKKNSSTSAGL